MNDYTKDKKINIIKYINFNKSCWKDLIDITCEIYRDGGINYSIRLVKGGYAVDEICRITFTGKMVKKWGKLLSVHIEAMMTSFKMTDSDVRKDVEEAVAEAFKDFEGFLKTHTLEVEKPPKKRRKVQIDVYSAFKALEKLSRIDKNVDFNKYCWKDIIDITCEIYKDGSIGYEIEMILPDGSKESIFIIAITKQMLEQPIVNIVRQK